jgi:hypothetical protein
MAVTLPDIDDFELFFGEDIPDDQEERVTLFIQMAADLLWLATGIDDDPSDTRLTRLVQDAILDMASYSYVNRNDLSSSYSPFNSERIGSYSYSKGFTASALVGQSGVPLFDKIVAYLTQIDWLTYDSGTSTEVFRYCDVPFVRIGGREYDPEMVCPPPGIWGGNIG